MDSWLSDVMQLAEPHQAFLLSMAAVSIVFFVASLLALPFLVARAPVDYFVRTETPKGPLIARVLRNVAGAILLLSGVLMLFLPGQGLLSILLGLSLLDFPGKRALLRRMVSKKNVAKPLQWLRVRAHKTPFELPHPQEH